MVQFREFLSPNTRSCILAPDEDANLVGMRLYGGGPFHRELKTAIRIAKKSHFVIKTGDVIYNKLFAWKGTFGVVTPELDGMFVSDKFPTYELDRAKVDEGYLRWYFRYPRLWDEARGMSTGSAALSKLTLNPPKFLLLTIPLPPPPEQRRIAARLDELSVQLQAARDLRKDASDAAKALVRAFLNELSADVELTGRIGDVLLSAPRNGWSARCDNAPGGVAVLSLGAVTGHQYRATEFKRTSLPVDPSAHYWLAAGDLLITRSNTPVLVGHAAIYSGSPYPCIYPDLMMKLSTNDEAVDRRFVWYWLQSPVARNFIEQNAKGTSPTMRKISQPIVMGIPFPTGLSLAAQHRLVGVLDAMLEKTSALMSLQTETATQIGALMPSLLDRAFKGGL